jgi:hypothetical protein
LLHLGQSVDFVVSMTFLRSPVFAIFAIAWEFSLWTVSAHAGQMACGFNGAVPACKCVRNSLLPVYMKLILLCLDHFWTVMMGKDLASDRCRPLLGSTAIGQ